MKKLLLLSVIISGIIVSCTEQKAKSPVEGVWQVVSWQMISNDTISWKLGVNVTGTEMKIWSGNYFTFVGQYKMNDSTINNYGGGSYVLNGDKYQEDLIYPSSSSVKILLDIKNDTIIQKWPCDENWQIDKSNYNMQKLIRKD